MCDRRAFCESDAALFAARLCILEQLHDATDIVGLGSSQWPFGNALDSVGPLIHLRPSVLPDSDAYRFAGGAK